MERKMGHFGLAGLYAFKKHAFYPEQHIREHSKY